MFGNGNNDDDDAPHVVHAHLEYLCVDHCSLLTDYSTSLIIGNSWPPIHLFIGDVYVYGLWYV
jgi:hypothetical protein